MDGEELLFGMVAQVVRWVILLVIIRIIAKGVAVEVFEERTKRLPPDEPCDQPDHRILPLGPPPISRTTSSGAASE